MVEKTTPKAGGGSRGKLLAMSFIGFMILIGLMFVALVINERSGNVTSGDRTRITSTTCPGMRSAPFTISTKAGPPQNPGANCRLEIFPEGDTGCIMVKDVWGKVFGPFCRKPNAPGVRLPKDITTIWSAQGELRIRVALVPPK